MSKLTLAKHLHLCFSMLKDPKPQLTNPTTTTAHHHSPPCSTAAATTTTTTFTKSYNSLYEDTLPATSSDTDMPDAEAPTTADLSAAYASRRFFFSSPGRSNSIVDSLSLSSLEVEEEPPTDEEEVVAGGVAVQTYSPDPYADFRRSMEEMVAAREIKGVEEAWEYLQELLLSYLALNPKNTHKYIVGAFSDLIFSLSSPHDNHKYHHIHNHHHDDHDHDHDHDNAEDDVVGSTSLSALSSSSSSCCGGNGGEIMDE